MFPILPCKTHSMRTRDGVRLDADVYCPVGEGPFPVLLMRQPYGRAIASTIVYAHPRWYAKHGYIVVIQDVRGRGTSEGEFDLFTHEVEDAEDTLQWAAQLTHSDGQIGMYGFSYQGMTQLYAAQTKRASLKTIVPAMTGYRLYEDWAYENGALCLQLGLTWAIQLAAETARRKRQKPAYQALLAAAKSLPLSDGIAAQPTVLEETDSFFHSWISQPQFSHYWKGLTPQLEGIDIPTLHIGGWFDPYLRGDIRLHRELSHRQPQQHHLWIGPWGHIPWGQKVGEVDFGPAAMSPVDTLQIQWFDHVLKGEPLSRKIGESENIAGRANTSGDVASKSLQLSPERPICLFEMGRNQWRSLSSWPQENIATYFLHGQGLENIRTDSGLLTRERPVIVSHSSVVHDPWNPAPARGGHSALPAGMFERTDIDLRGDILTFTSSPLEQALRVAGVVEFMGAIASSAISYDLCVVLSRVTEGKVYNLTQGYRRISLSAFHDEAQLATVPLHPTCFSLSPGECLRLSLSLACFPAYAVNPGTGTQPELAESIEAQIITVSIATGGERGASVRLPLAPINKAELS